MGVVFRCKMNSSSEVREMKVIRVQENLRSLRRSKDVGGI
jgi:hypothetical protein